MWFKLAAVCVLMTLELISLTDSTPQYQSAGNRQRFRGTPNKAPIIQRGDQAPPPDRDLDLEAAVIQEPHPLSDVLKSNRHFSYHQGVFEPRKPHPCEQSSCYPATGNLLIGREDQLYASSTCGLHKQQRYCIVSHLEDRKKCFWCDSSPKQKPNSPLNHNIKNIVYRVYPGTKQKTWWQSENGKENVYIQLNLEAEFHFTHLIITFKTFRPAAMLIERSFDFGKTWHVYRYFAHNCTESFPGVKQEQPTSLTDVICESRYSGIDPLTDGEAIYRVIPPTLPVLNPYSEQVQSLLKMTNLRINFTKLHTLGDDLLDRREEIQEKYYYAITHMVVRGSCSCYGHANRCLPSENVEPKPDMVHGKCECTHNTKGRNCEQCEDFFNDLPWRPALGDQTNACKRCNCNNHATSCHFDPALYEATGQVSGGVCDGCQHNTLGANCERCKPFYYRDPSRDIQDPEVCRPCDCDPRGSLEGGICDTISDEANNLVAGTCHCKTNVDGRRCDSCKNGFWNFTESNPDGCQPCTCDTLGTVGNQGCNVEFGTCTCKRYVTGRNCNQCLPEYYGLSEQDYGCSPCNCDLGGSFDNYCDVITGQCRCRAHMTGRTCDTPNQQYFTVNLDFMLYEAEQAQTNGQVVIREPNRDGGINTFTGPGLVQVSEGNYLEYTVNNIKTTTDYDTIIRYEPTQPGAWEDVDVRFERPDHIDPNGPCADYNLQDDYKRVALVSDRRAVKVVPSTCLEAGKVYKVILEFKRYSFDKETPSASVLIDSIVLIPTIQKLPIFHGSIDAEDRLEEYTRYNCDQLMWQANHGNIPEICEKYHNSIGSYIIQGAEACQCNPTGSVSKLCAPHGGHCTCKPNVVGRKCDQCAPGTYGFGPEGCKACDCNSIGAMDNFCNITTGQCKCRAHTYGRECNQCRTGFWNFPNCQRCDCHGHADICDSRTGACINCRDNTEGHYCDTCIKAFYGDPRIGVDIPCRPCPCPGSPGSNHSHAETCSLDPNTKDVVCDCQEGYAGLHCDVCSDNFYGNPEVPGGSCQPCDCSGKINYLAPGNCDPHTGFCRNCLDNTAGDHCEVCREGYFRYGPDQLCQECNCYILGTNNTAGACNPEGGQCICYPNVTGITCNECLPYHWKIASGQGCEPCGCDSQGSLSPQCNRFDGQCECKPGFGGRQCNECMREFWGDPKLECKQCQCNIEGSLTPQCDMLTGECVCRPGIGGYNCDTCARGYLGRSPDCKPCGECFDNWDRILMESRNATHTIIDRAKDIKKVGATGAYTKEFEDMQSQLDEIEQLLNNTDDINVSDIEKELQALRNKITETENGRLNETEETLDETKEDLYYTELKVNNLNESIQELKKKTLELEKNGTQLQEANVRGALTLIQNAKYKADLAADKAQRAMDTIKEADLRCKATESYLNTTENKYKQQLEMNRQTLDEIKDKIQGLNEQIPELNNLVCDGNGDPCDAVCGGAGCGSCGNSISCHDGAKQLAETAVTFANNTEVILRQKESEANEFIRNVSHINTERTRIIAQETFDKINSSLGRSNETLKDANQLIDDIKDFLARNHTKPEELNDIIEEALSKKLIYNKEEVDLLARNIRDAVDRLTNTDYIIEATKYDLQKVNELKHQALAAKEKSNKLLTDAEEVKAALNQTTQAQKDAVEAINNARDSYIEVEDSLNKISNKTQDAQSTTSLTSQKINTIKEKLNELQGNITDNGIFAENIIKESINTMKNAENTQNEFQKLKQKYDTAKVKLHAQLEEVKKSKERSKEVISKALDLGARVTKTQEDIEKLENNSRSAELTHLENKLNNLIDSMNRYTKDLEKKVEYYNQCL